MTASLLPWHCLPSVSSWGGWHEEGDSVPRTLYCIAVAQWEGALAYGWFFAIFCLTPLRRHGVFLNDNRSQNVTHHFSPSGLVLQRLQQRCNVVTAQAGEH